MKMFWCNTQGHYIKVKTWCRRSETHTDSTLKLQEGAGGFVWGKMMRWDGVELVVGIPVAGIAADPGKIWRFCSEVCTIL